MTAAAKPQAKAIARKGKAAAVPSAAKEFHEEVGPTELYDPVIRNELKRASVWIGLAVLVGLIVLLAQPILLIIGGIVIAAMLDGGARLIGRVLPIPRGFRLALVMVCVIAFFYWTVTLAGSSLAEQAANLQIILQAQLEKAGEMAQKAGFKIASADIKEIGSQILSSVGRVTEVVSSAMGTIANVAMMIVLGIFMAAEPRLYERGVAWMLPLREREHFYKTADEIGRTLRRLMAGRLVGMTIEGIGVWLLLWAGGVQMAALLGLLTGLLAFLPNIGAIISGLLMIAVGFYGGFDTGIYTIFVYLFVHTIDGYLIVPMVAKKAVDLAPALVLGAQILFGALFGILGLALADPIIAIIKVALERQSERNEARNNGLPVATGKG
jgi:predicted PurR-regulated permease PerM